MTWQQFQTRSCAPLEAEIKEPGVLNEEFATRKNCLKGVEHFPDFRTSSGNRDFWNKNGKKKPLYQLSLYLYEIYIYPKVTKMSL